VGDDLFQEKDGCGVFVDDCILWSRKGEGDTHDDVMGRHAALVGREYSRD
jgi:hypothetical protein